MSTPDTPTTSDDTPERKSIEEIVDEHQDVFETLRDHPDPEFAEKYGEQPLRYLTNGGGD